MTAFDVDALAAQALDLMMQVPHDSFGPIDACRALPGFFDRYTDEQRGAVLDRLRDLCMASAG